MIGISGIRRFIEVSMVMKKESSAVVRGQEKKS
jgi:hypothetical protein